MTIINKYEKKNALKLFQLATTNIIFNYKVNKNGRLIKSLDCRYIIIIYLFIYLFIYYYYYYYNLYNNNTL